MQQTFPVTPMSISKLWKRFSPNFESRKTILPFYQSAPKIWLVPAICVTQFGGKRKWCEHTIKTELLWQASGRSDQWIHWYNFSWNHHPLFMDQIIYGLHKKYSIACHKNSSDKWLRIQRKNLFSHFCYTASLIHDEAHQLLSNTHLEYQLQFYF